MSKISLPSLKSFCRQALEKEGMKSAYAAIVAEVLSETDAFGTHSHGTKNLYAYIQKCHAGGIDILAEPEIIAEGPAYAAVDAHMAFGMIPAVQAMECACTKAAATGIALVTVRNSCHFGAAGYYANIAARRGMIGLAMSNVDPNMTAPGAKGMLLGNNPFAYAAPSRSVPSIFLDIAMSNVASLKVVQARKDGTRIPDTWIVDKDGLPTTDPSRYPDEGAMQPMAMHKGYGLAIMVDLLTGILSGGHTSMDGQISSWCFAMEKANQVCHTFIAIAPQIFPIGEGLTEAVEQMADTLRRAPKARNAVQIFTPGEIEWNRHHLAERDGIALPDDVANALIRLSEEEHIHLEFIKE